MSKFLSLVEENTPNNTPEVDEFTKEGLEQLEGYMAQVELNLGYAGELLVDLNDRIVEKRAGELGAKIQKDLHNFMDNFGGTSVEDGEEVPAEDYEVDMKDLKQVDVALDTANKLKAAADPKRPSRGVKKIEKSIANIGTAVSKKLDQVAKAIK